MHSWKSAGKSDLLDLVRMQPVQGPELTPTPKKMVVIIDFVAEAAK